MSFIDEDKHQAECECGFKSSKQTELGDALQELKAHREEVNHEAES